jgi:hypothetical protein
MLTTYKSNVPCKPGAADQASRRAFWRELFKILAGLAHF